MFESRNKRFLLNIKKEVDNLPWKIWEDNDTQDPNYINNKRRELIGRVMHITFKIQGYITKRYPQSNLIKDFSSCSFFPKGVVFEPFHVENNKVWSNGKKSYLCFIDQLIDYVSSEDYIEADSLRITIMKIAALIVLSGVATSIMFADCISNYFVFPFEISMKWRVFSVIGFVVLIINLLWMKKAKDLLPLTTTYIGAVLTLLIG